MSRLVIARHDGLHCAALDAETITDLYAARLDRAELAGAVVTARVIQPLPGQGAAIVRWADNGQGHEGYWSDAAAKNAKAGDAVRLQIKADAYAEKLPQLKRDIALPGRWLVHLPQGRGVKFSRQSKDTLTAPEALAALPGGWVLRRAAQAATVEQIMQEAQALAALGQQEALPAPTIWQRALIEHGAAITKIFAYDAPTARAVSDWCATYAPELAACVEQAADALDWDSLFAEATATTLPLAGGGSLTIERTRAAWVVDVDAGAAQNHLAVNVAAAQALARHCRLRNLGGMIIADFISLPRPSEQQALLKALRQAVADDPAGVEVFSFTTLGLIEMTRTRRGNCLADLIKI